MAFDNISPYFKIFYYILKFIPNFVKIIINYWRRPKLKLSVANRHIEFLTNSGEKQSPDFISIIIENCENSDVSLDLNKACINGESLSYIIQQNLYFSKTHDGTKSDIKISTNNALLNLFRENWTTSKFIKIAAHETLEIPIYPQGMSDSMYFKVLSHAKIFFPKRNIVIDLTVNSGQYYYSINRFDFLKILVNKLVYSRNA